MHSDAVANPRIRVQNPELAQMNPNLRNTFESSGRRLRLALCQVETRQWDLDGNTECCLNALEQAAADGAQLPITPECVFHGYGFCASREATLDKRREIVETADGPRLTAVRDLAKRHAMAVVAGFADNEMVTRVRAAENEVYVAVVNHAGRFNGGSFAVGPGGEALLLYP